MAASTIEIDPAREQAELEAYLGSEFELRRLQGYQAQLDEEYALCADEQRFYRTSNAYLYNLTAFAMTGTKLPYLRELTRLVPPGARLLDYGCGIGSDGLLLLEAGYRVEFAEFDNPSSRYLHWRLEHRGLKAPVHNLDREVPAGFDAAYAFDVIEHVEDPSAFLAEMERRARLVVVNLLEPDRADREQAIHHELPIPEIRRRAIRRGLRSYRILYDRSHLLVYASDRAGAGARLRGEGMALAERARRQLKGRSGA
jgi:SAM-dependent methyltransferase